VGLGMSMSNKDKVNIPRLTDLDALICDEEKRIIGFSDSFMLVHFESVIGTAFIDGAEYTLCDNSVVILKPLCFYKFEFLSGAVGRTLSFSADDILPEAKDRLVDIFGNAGDVTHRFLRNNSIAITNALSRIDEYIKGDAHDELYLKMLLSEVVLLSDGVKAVSIVDESVSLEIRVYNYLSENYDASFSLTRLANRFFKSKFHLSRRFLSFIGVPPHKFVSM
jgi:hypothetical protein